MVNGAEAVRRERVVDVDTVLGGGRETPVVTLDSEACLVPAGLLDANGTSTVFFQPATRPVDALDFRAFFGVGLKMILFKLVMMPKTKQDLTLDPVQYRVQPSASGHPNWDSRCHLALLQLY